MTPLSVDADLSLEIEGAEATLTGSGAVLFVTFDSLRDVIRVLRTLPTSPDNRLLRTLRRTDLTIDIQVRNTTVFRAGVDAHPGIGSAVLGVKPLEARFRGLIRSICGDLVQRLLRR